jgi:hypothetical protein
MTEHVSAEFHAEIIVALFNDYRDLRKVRERARTAAVGSVARALGTGG